MSIPLCVQGLLTRVRDNNKHVQEAACSALATLEEAAGRELLESSRITAILKTFAAALQVLLLCYILQRRPNFFLLQRLTVVCMHE